MFKNCFGHCGVDIGQNLDPIPPAKITKWFAIIITFNLLKVIHIQKLLLAIYGQIYLILLHQSYLVQNHRYYTKYDLV